MALTTQKRQIKEILIYCACGTVSAVADAAIYFPLVNLTPVPAPVGVLMGTVGATFVSFLLMKPFVFRSNDWSKAVLLPELTRFITTRILSIFLEVLFSLITVSLFKRDENIMRIVGWLIIAVGNYVCAKYIVFKYRRKC